MTSLPDWMTPGWKDSQGRTRRIASGKTKEMVEAFAAKQGVAVEAWCEIEQTHARQSLQSNWHQPPAKTTTYYGLLTA